MSRSNIKHDELRTFAELILSAEDYGKVLQKLNGSRMGMINKYKTDTSPTREKRIQTLKNLIEAYK